MLTTSPGFLGAARAAMTRADGYRTISDLIATTLVELETADVRDTIRARLCEDAFAGSADAVWALLCNHY